MNRAFARLCARIVHAARLKAGRGPAPRLPRRQEGALLKKPRPEAGALPNRRHKGTDVKLIIANPDNSRGLPERSLFDVRADPGETENLAGGARAKDEARLEEHAELQRKFATGEAVSAQRAGVQGLSQGLPHAGQYCPKSVNTRVKITKAVLIIP